MSRRETVQECCQAVGELLPGLARPEQQALGRLVCGVVHAESAQLSRAGAATPGAAQDRSKLRRAQRRLLERTLQGRRGGSTCCWMRRRPGRRPSRRGR
jgi:hypothetical protein